MHCPPGFGPRPPITGWYAEFADLTAPPGTVGYATDAMRFMGATFDPSALYRFLHVRRMLAEEGQTTAAISEHVGALRTQLLKAVADTPLAGAELVNPPEQGSGARFLAFRHPRAAEWQQALLEQDCITDVRGEVLRIGPGLYNDASDIERFADLARALPT
jgi:selenocysteine lyase/cysteine desulfurase